MKKNPQRKTWNLNRPGAGGGLNPRQDGHPAPGVIAVNGAISIEGV